MCFKRLSFHATVAGESAGTGAATSVSVEAEAAEAEAVVSVAGERGTIPGVTVKVAEPSVGEVSNAKACCSKTSEKLVGVLMGGEATPGRAAVQGGDNSNGMVGPTRKLSGLQDSGAMTEVMKSRSAMEEMM